LEPLKAAGRDRKSDPGRTACGGPTKTSLGLICAYPLPRFSAVPSPSAVARMKGSKRETVPEAHLSTTAVIVKLLLSPRQSRGASFGG
jgi:hypothetical protein